MNYAIDSITIENFKSYEKEQRIRIADLSVFLGANSSGKSSALQTLLVLKQTMECNSRDIELLLSGKYVALGDFDDVIHDKSREDFSLGLDFKCIRANEATEKQDSYRIIWHFEKAEDKFQARLSTVEIIFGDKCVSFVRLVLNKYQMIINNEETPVIVHINNLNLANKLYIKYDVEFNKLFVSFINDMKGVIEGKKSRKLAANELASLKVVPDFYMEFLNDAALANQDELKDDECVKTAEQIIKLIEEFSLYQNPLGSDGWIFPKETKKNLMKAAVMKSEKNSELKKICGCYSKLLKEYKKNNPRIISNYKGEEVLSRYMYSHHGYEMNYMVEAFNWVNDFYDDFEDVIGKVFFVGPIRENPQGLYSIGFEQNPKYVGPTGSNFASVLLHENKKKQYVLPYDEEDNISLWEALNIWSSHLNIASAIKVSHPTSYGIKVTVSDTQNKTADIMNVGIGTSQVLPVLITGLLSDKGETLIFEQPELHLHPFSQSRLADFFVALIKHGRKVIIETHSEAFILRLRYHVLRENCNNDSIAISFFQNKQGTKVSLCNISNYGNIDYPNDFKDETQELLNDLMRVALKKELQ